jgi:hypothetical protein
MTTPIQTETQVYQPSAPQRERAVSLRRFNRLAIYLPLVLAGIIILLIVGLLLWGILSPNIRGTQDFVSGLADLILILTIVPLLLVCAILPLAAVGYAVYSRQQPKREYGRLQILFWRLDSLLEKAKGKVEPATLKAAQPIIAGRAQLSYWQTLFNQIKKLFIRR